MDYYTGLKKSHADFKPTVKYTRVSGVGFVDDNNANLQESIPSMKELIERLSEMDADSIKDHDHAARIFLGRMYFSINCAHYSLVPKGEGDDLKVKQTMLDIIKRDSIMTKASLRFFRMCLASDVATYMKRLIAIKPEILSNTREIDDDYYDKIFKQKFRNRRDFSLKF